MEKIKVIIYICVYIYIYTYIYKRISILTISTKKKAPVLKEPLFKWSSMAAEGVPF